MIELAAILIILHAPGNATIEINPAHVTSLRTRHKGSEEYATKGANCQINLADGRYALVTESCAQVRKMVEDAK